MLVTALMEAAGRGDLEGVKRNLNEVGEKNEYGRTALMLAIRGGHTNCIPFLKEEIGMQDNWGWTALILAAYNGNIDCIPLLKEELGKRDNDGVTALMYATEKGHLDCIRLLKEEIGVQNNWGWTTLMKAAKGGRTNCISSLEKEIGMQNNWGWTALMWAAYYGKTDCARLLLSESGKQTTNKSSSFFSGTTALMMAAHENYPEIVGLLLPYEQGLKDSEGHTAQWYAYNSLWRGDFTQVRKLLENEGAERIPPPNHELTNQERINEPIVENESLESPPTRTEETLISSAIQGDLNTLRRRLDQAGQKDSSGMTALMHAAFRGQTEVVRLLRPLEAHLQDGRGWTALMHAVRGGHEECIGLLLLERDLKDGEGRTAEDVANGLPDGKKKITPLLRKKVRLPDLPDELSSFQLTGRLGRGAFGTVYTAHNNGRNVAVKVVNLEEYNDEDREKPRAEARMLLSLNHPNIIRCLGTGENDDDDTYVIVTELCCGDLREEMNRRKNAGRPYTDREVWKTIREVADALTYLHEKGHVHRDLKLVNILLAPDGRCILGDFGVAKVLEDSSQMGTYAGTQHYMAPEILRGESYDKSVDVWALGVIGYKLCTGMLPFFEETDIAERDPPVIENRDGGLITLISRMLSKDPEDRPTAQDVLEEAVRHQ
ncbi:Kinase, NEK [Giardia muris]|uniref:Kinase, NEK n=1 Tax=Giardia muris TaxID=5742 RepID=A0A4Z1T950_GIAMU|nr:Kinase, NEK [Giardia muris]|eukprot:TNJ29041.1 Kinase, NEK [Giardia muris]